MSELSILQMLRKNKFNSNKFCNTEWKKFEELAKATRIKVRNHFKSYLNNVTVDQKPLAIGMNKETWGEAKLILSNFKELQEQLAHVDLGEYFL